MTVINATRGASKKYVDDKLASEASDKQGKIDALNAKVGSVTVSGNTITRDYGTVTNQVLVDSKSYTNAQVAAEEARASAAEENIEDLVTTGTEKVDGQTRYVYGAVTGQLLNDAEEYTNNQITQRIAGVYSVKGSCENYTDLPNTGQAIGDVWNVRNGKGSIGSADYVPPGTNYVWTGSEWDAMGGTIDLSAYETTDAVNTKLAEYSKTSTINPVLEQHQNKIFQKSVTVLANETIGRKFIEGLTQAFVESDPAVIVSPDPLPSPTDQTITSIQAAVDCGLYATGLGWDTQAGKAYITFSSDIAPTDSINLTLTFVDLSTGIKIPVNNGNAGNN